MVPRWNGSLACGQNPSHLRVYRLPYAWIMSRQVLMALILDVIPGINMTFWVQKSLWLDRLT